MTIYWIALNAVKGLGPVKISRLIERFGSPQAVIAQPPGFLAAEGMISPEVSRQLADPALMEKAREQAGRAADAGIAILTPQLSQYPPMLRQIFAPPPVLFVRGDTEVFTRTAVAVVGTRRPSAYGVNVAASMCREIAGAGVVIVSGLALGIDTVAHRTCLDAGTPTVAVLGCGIDIGYPASNRALSARIAGSGGAVVSEFPVGTTPEAYNFPRRNRIISGLAAGTLIVEAGTRSGALITAQYALQQGRDIFAVPGPIFSDKSDGTFRLLTSGAIPVRSGHDVLSVLATQGPMLQGCAVVNAVTMAPEDLTTPAERLILDTLSGEPMRIDQIAETARKAMGELFDVLLNLELKGLARQVPGQRYIRV